MITEYRIKGSLGIGTGLLCGIGGMLAGTAGGPVGRPIAFGLWIVGTLVMTYGCVNYIRAKGYHPLLGLPALIPVPIFPPGLVGLVIACVLPDRTPTEHPTEAQRQAHQARLKAVQEANAAHQAQQPTPPTKPKPPQSRKRRT